MPFYILDSNTLSRYIHKKDKALQKKVDAHIENCYLSTLVLAELDYGAAKRPDIPKYRERVDIARQMFEEAILPFDDEAAWHTGRIRAHLEAAGNKIGPYDTMIAGHACSIGAIIVTHNVDEFKRVPGLIVEDWQSGS